MQVEFSLCLPARLGRKAEVLRTNRADLIVVDMARLFEVRETRRSRQTVGAQGGQGIGHEGVDKDQIKNQWKEVNAG